MLIYIIACSLPELCSADDGIFGHASEPFFLNGVLSACSGSCCLLTQLQGGTEKALHDRCHTQLAETGSTATSVAPPPLRPGQRAALAPAPLPPRAAGPTC